MDRACDTSIIESVWDNGRVINSGYSYVYTNIGGKCIENGKIFPEYGADNDKFGRSVALSGGTALFGTIGAGEENGGSVYIFFVCVP